MSIYMKFNFSQDDKLKKYVQSKNENKLKNKDKYASGSSSPVGEII